MQKAIILTMVLMGVAISAHWVVLAQHPENQAEASQAIEVSAKKFEFSPDEIHVRKGTRVELKVHTEDVTHSIKLDSYPEGSKERGTRGLLFDHAGGSAKATKEADQVINFVAQEPGTYDFKCSTFCGLGHSHMKGRLIVDQ